MSQPIVLGLGGNVDHELVWDTGRLQRRVLELGITSADVQSVEGLAGERDLIRVLLWHMRLGVGGERFVSSPTALESFGSRFDWTSTLGGTGLRAGLAALELGVPSTVHVAVMNGEMAQLLPAGLQIISPSGTLPSHPHIIVQFRQGARISLPDDEIVSPRSNRVIFVNDPANAKLPLSAEWLDAVRDARFVLVSGLNSIRSSRLLGARLQEISAGLATVQPSCTVMLEDAEYHDRTFADIVLESLSPSVAVFSLNEDELSSRLGRDVDVLNAEEVMGALREVSRRAEEPAILLHTSRYAVLYSERIPLAGWEEPISFGVGAAGARYVAGESVTAGLIRAMMQSCPRSSEGARVVERLRMMLPGRVVGEACFDVSVSRPTTIGLGDAFVGGFVAGRSPCDGEARFDRHVERK